MRAQLAVQLESKTIQQIASAENAPLIKQPTDEELRELVVRVRALPRIANEMLTPDQRDKV